MNKRGQIRESEIQQEFNDIRINNDKKHKQKIMVYLAVSVFLVIIIVSVFALFFYFINNGIDDKNDTITDNESDTPNPIDNPDLEIPGPNVSRGTSGNRINTTSGTGGGGGEGDTTTTTTTCTNDFGCNSTGIFCDEENMSYNCTQGADACYDRINISLCTGKSKCFSGTGCTEMQVCTNDSNCSSLNNECRTGTCNLSINICMANYNFSGTACSLGSCDGSGNCRDYIYPQFLSYYDNTGINKSQIARFNVTVVNTNGSVFLNINGRNYKATNITSNIYNVSINMTYSGTYNYNWISYGSGLSHNRAISSVRQFKVNGTEIHITQDWLNSMGGRGDYLLTQDQSTYILDTDVTTERTAFWIVGENITFNLNGHTINYDVLDIPAINNGNFETNDFTGWDMTGALGYYRRNQSKAVNDSVLVLPALYSVIYSPAFTIPKANYTFMTSVYMVGDMPYWQNYSMIKIDFVDANTKEVINIDNGAFRNSEGVSMPCGVSYSETRYYQNQTETDTVYHALRQPPDHELMGVVCEFRTPNTPEVRIRIRTYDATVIDYLDFRGFQHPAIGTLSSQANGYHQVFSSRDAPLNSGRAFNIKIINGTIIEGNARSGRGISSTGLKNLYIKDLKLIMQSSPNAQGISSSETVTEPGNHYIDNLTLEVPQAGVFDRDEQRAAIALSGNATIINSIIRTDTAGILIYPALAYKTEGLNISNNIIEMGFREAPNDRNHAGIWFSRFKNAKIYNNKITGQGYIGICIDNNLAAEVYNNTILMWGRGDLRFSDSENSAMMGIEFYDYHCEDGNCRSADSKVYNNNVTVIIDPLKKEINNRPEVRAMNFRNRYAFNESSCGNNSIYNNIFTAINLEPNLNSYGLSSGAAALQFQLIPPVLKEQIYNNTFQSNNVIVSATMYSGYLKGFDLFDNRFVRLDAGVIPAHHVQHNAFESISTWGGGGGLFRDNIWLNTSPDEDGYLVNGHLGTFRIENTFKLRVLNNGNPVSSASVVITDNLGNIVYTGQSDSNGYIETILKDFDVNLTQIWYNPYRISVTNGGNTRILTVTSNKAHKEYVVDLGNTVNSAPVVNAGNDITVVSNSSGWWGVSSDTYLKPSVDDDGLPLNPGKVIVNWTIVFIEGGGSLSFLTPSNTSYVQVRPTKHGNYTLRITASDGSLSSYDDVTIFVRNNYSLTGNPNDYRGFGSLNSVTEDSGEKTSAQSSEVFTLNPFEALINWFRQLFHLEPLNILLLKLSL